MLQFGCDPEFFAAVKVDGVDFAVSPALLEEDSGLKFIYQDVNQKHPVYLDEGDFLWMMDGSAFELTIKKPLNSAQEVFNILTNSTLCLSQFLSQFTWNGDSLQFYRKPVININPKWYISRLDNYKIYQGFIFGCDPDKDAIIENYVCKTINVETHEFRYGGGHVHISGLQEFQEFPIPAVKLMAITLGNFSIANSPYPELEKQRATTYGKPGRYRVQKYKNGNVGIEYRTPSNSWTSYSLEKMEEFFEWSEIASKFLINKREDIINNFLQYTIESIMNSDQELAKNILLEVKKVI